MEFFSYLFRDIDIDDIIKDAITDNFFNNPNYSLNSYPILFYLLLLYYCQIWPRFYLYKVLNIEFNEYDASKV